MGFARPDKPVLEALNRIRHDKPLFDWLLANQRRFRDETVLQQDGKLLRQAQGRAQLMDDLITLISLETSRT